MQAATAWVFLLLFGIVSSNLLPGDKRLGHNHHHHHHQEHHHHQSPHDLHHGEEEEEHHHHHHHEEEPEHGHHQKEDGERSGKSLADIDFSSAVLDEETGLKCVRTDETVETVEREKLLSCTHSSINICHYTYVTKFSPFQPRVCEDVYSKKCNIVFTRRAEETTEQHCYRPWSRRCDQEEEEEEEGARSQCRRVSESWCVTRYQEGKALTSCNKIPQTLCSPANCQIVQEEEKCHNKSVTVVNEVPDESCDIIPSKICRNINKLVPHLEPVQECKDQPRQVCSYGLKSPSLREKPLITKWCYNDKDAPGSFGEKDRKPKSDIFETENIPSSLLISTNPLVPPIHNALIDDEPDGRASQPETEAGVAILDGEVSERGRPRAENKIFGNKLISQSLLPPPPVMSGPTRMKAPHHENRPGKSEKPLTPSGGGAGSDDQNLIINDRLRQPDDEELPIDEQFDEFIDTFLDTVKQDPENFVPGEKIDDDVDTVTVIDEVFEFDKQQKKGSSKSQLSISKELRPDDTPIAKVLKHDNEGSVSKTIIIQNNPTAHKIFGVKNPPQKFSPEFLSSLTSLNRDMKDIGQRKSKSGAKPISRDHTDDTQRFLSAQKVRSGFSFGISDISQEERDEYESGGSAEFHFKSGWNNKAPPPGLVLFRTTEETSTTASGLQLQHQIRDDTSVQNNHDQHNLRHLEPPSLETVEPETVSDDVSAFRNPKFNANQFFLPTTSTSSQEIQDSPRKNPNLDLSLMVSQENQLLKSNSFKTFPLIQDNSASSFPRIPDSSIESHNTQHNQNTLEPHNGINVVDTSVGGKINDLGVKSSRLQSQDDDGDYYSGGEGVSDGDNVILLLDDEAGPDWPTSQYEEVIISPHLGIQSEPGTDSNSISNNRLMKNSASTVADYDRSPSSRQHLPTKEKYFPTKEMDAIAGLSEINSGHQYPQPVGNAIPVENLKSIHTSSPGYNSVNPAPPTPSQAARDKFRPPSTFLYGFKPMTTTESVALSGSSRPINYYSPPPPPPVAQVESVAPPVKYKPAYKPTRKPKNFVLDAISSLLDPITQTLTNLLRG